MEIPTLQSPQTPTGSKFIVDRCPFTPGSSIEVSMLEIDESKLYDWPMVYILANDKEAYVGQTTSVVRRMSEHGANPEKKAFTTANIIFNEEANMSVITDYESRLIQLMHADGKFTLTNKVGGITDSNYFSKTEYASMFEDLWSELQTMDLVGHTIDELEESEVFKYSPYKELNADQKVALSKILSAINNASFSKPLVIQGMPGTGKTILAIYLLKALRDNPDYSHLNIRILEPVTSLRETLQRSLHGVRNLSKYDILGPSDLVKQKYTNGIENKPFDILLVDEAHRLKQRKNIVSYGSFDKTNKILGFDNKATQLDWVLAQAKLPIFFYDPMQVVGPSGISAEIMKNRLGAAFENPIRLESQMRVKGGIEYLKYIEQVLWDRNPFPQQFSDYKLIFHSSFHDFYDSFEKDLSKHDLTRMIAGYAWEWKTKKDKSPEAFDIEIEGIKIRWNCKQENWVGLGVEDPKIAHEMGVIHSIQGYDLSYAYVVIGPDLIYDEINKRVTASRKDYYDKNGKNTATLQELEDYIKHIYYVLLTRGIYGTHIYVCDKKLRTYMSRFFR